MDLINYMAAIQTQGGAINVGAMMASLGTAPGTAAAPAVQGAFDTTGSPSVSGLVGALKAREFKA
jgi:hypothetical protein